jgi:hypothetical protein
MIGVRTGRRFGPVIFFGQGGTEAEVIDDVAYALPPLNMQLARDLMSRTRLYRQLSDQPRPARGSGRHRPDSDQGFADGDRFGRSGRNGHQSNLDRSGDPLALDAIS